MDRVPNLKRYIASDATPQELLELERQVVVLTDKEAEIFSGALDIEAIDGMGDILRVLRRLDNYKLYDDISTPAQLGRMLVDTGAVYIPQSALPYVDLSRVAAKFEAEHSGAYTQSGYVLKVDDGEPAQRPYVVKVELSSPRLEACGATYSLLLPASSEELFFDAKAVLAVGALDECRVTGVETSVEAIARVGVRGNEIMALNELAAELSFILEDNEKYKTFCAAVEVEQPGSILWMTEIAVCLDDYTLLPLSINNADEYGRYLLYDSGEIEDFKDEVKDFIDYEEYGKYRIEEDDIRETGLGWLRRRYGSFPRAGETQGQDMNI